MSVTGKGTLIGSVWLKPWTLMPYFDFYKLDNPAHQIWADWFTPPHYHYYHPKPVTKRW
jgi:hypothetical protein